MFDIFETFQQTPPFLIHTKFLMLVITQKYYSGSKINMPTYFKLITGHQAGWRTHARQNHIKSTCLERDRGCEIQRPV